MSAVLAEPKTRVKQNTFTGRRIRVVRVGAGYVVRSVYYRDGCKVSEATLVAFATEQNADEYARSLAWEEP